MVADSVRNCAHIMSTPAAISWSSLMMREVNANATELRKEPTATNFSLCLSLNIITNQITYLGIALHHHSRGRSQGTKTGTPTSGRYPRS